MGNVKWDALEEEFEIEINLLKKYIFLPYQSDNTKTKPEFFIVKWRFSY